MNRYVILFSLIILPTAGYTQQDSVQMEFRLSPAMQEKMQKNFKLEEKVFESILDAQQFQEQLPDGEYQTQMQIQQEEIVMKALRRGSDDEQMPNQRIFLTSRERFHTRQFDSRFELLELNMKEPENISVLGNSLSVFAIVLKEDIVKTGNGTYRIISARTSGEKLKLCPDEPYSSQPSVAIGSASLIGPDIVLTAFHCVKPYSLKDICFITGYNLLSMEGDVRMEFDEKDVEFGVELLQQDEFATKDIAVIRLSRKPEGKVPLKRKTDYRPSVGQRLYTLGYPLGLPLKLATNGNITGVGDYYFETNLDTYQGNSGSPVFSRDDHEMVGILVNGLVDFVHLGNCNISNVCYSDLCPPEKVLYIPRIQMVD